MQNIPGKYCRDVNNDIFSPISNIETVYYDESTAYDPYIKEYIDNIKKELIKYIDNYNNIDKIYPVGSIYMNMVDIKPETIFPNTTWARIQNRFLLGVGTTYGENTTGGEAAHKLTLNEMPSHTHTFSGSGTYIKPDGTIYVQAGNSADPPAYPLNSTVSATVTVNGTTGSSGGGAAHNNMPPYQTVYMWRRTA